MPAAKFLPVRPRTTTTPPVAVDEIVPVRNEIPERAAVMAERHAAFHAPRALLAQLDERQELHEFAVVADALAGRALGRVRARDLEEGAELAHDYAAASSVSRV